MKTFSLVLPDDLANASQAAARQLRLSRVEFIRRAIRHEIDQLQKTSEQEAMVKSIQAMKKSAHYQRESAALEEGFTLPTHADKDNWWKNPKS